MAAANQLAALHAPRELALPKTVFSLLPFADDPSELYRDVSHVVALESSSLFVSNGELYKVDHARPADTPKLLQSYVIDGCAFDGQISNRVFILTAEYSVLFCDLDKDELDFAEIQESFLSESEVASLPSDANTDMFADFNRKILVVATQTRILILTLAEEEEEEEGDGEEKGKSEGECETESERNEDASATSSQKHKQRLKMFVRCVSYIDVQLQLPPDGVTTFASRDKSNESLNTVLEFASKTFDPRIEFCSVWGTMTNASIVCSGNGNWVELYPIAKSAASSADKVWKPSASVEWEPKKSFYPATIKEHKSWISALSKGSPSSVCASGDESGGVLVWSAAAGGCDDRAFSKALYAPEICEGFAVTCIHNDEANNGFWIADASGKVQLAFYDVNRNVLEKIRVIRLVAEGRGATFLQWRGKDRLTADAASTADNAKGRLRVLCAPVGVMVECYLHDSISTILSASIEPAYGPGHRSIVEVCAIMPEFDLVVTAGCGDKAWVWNLNSCQLVATLVSKDRFFTSICCFDSGFVRNGNARIVTGHANGHTHDYILRFLSNGASTIDGMSVIESSQTLSLVSGEVKSMSLRQPLQQSALDSLDSPHSARSESIEASAKLRGISVTLAEAERALSLASGGDGDGGGGGSDKNKASDDVVPKKVIKIEHQATTEYIPLPVTSILCSVLGLYYVFCYSQTFIVVHSWEDCRALAQVQFDDMLVEISCLSTAPEAESDDLQNDYLTLVLQGRRNVKIFDALSGQVLSSFAVEVPGGSNIVASSALWDLPVAESPESRRIVGVCASSGPVAILFGDMSESIPIVLEEDKVAATTMPLVVSKTAVASGRSAVDGLVFGCRAFDSGFSPFASIWTLRSVYWIRCDIDSLTTHPLRVLKVQQYHVPDDKVRVVFAKSLKMKARAHQCLVALSDGTVVVLNL